MAHSIGMGFKLC